MVVRAVTAPAKPKMDLTPCISVAKDSFFDDIIYSVDKGGEVDLFPNSDREVARLLDVIARAIDTRQEIGFNGTSLAEIVNRNRVSHELNPLAAAIVAKKVDADQLGHLLVEFYS